jgi:hypothetical protein
MYLDQLLKKRQITTEEERLFVISLLDPQVEIPIFPLWDPDGNVLGTEEWRRIMAAAAVRETSKQFGLFSKKLLGDYAAAEFTNLGNSPTQRRIKALILMHLLPQFRLLENGGTAALTTNGRILGGNLANSEAQDFLTQFIEGRTPDPINVGKNLSAFRPADWINSRSAIPISGDKLFTGNPLV